MSVRCDLAFFRLLGRSKYNNIWVVKGKCMIVWLFFRDISCICLVSTWIYLPRLMNIGRYGYGMTNLFRNTAVTSVSILQENCDGVKIFYPKLYICIFYSKANKSKLKKNIIFIDICRKKLQWPVTQLKDLLIKSRLNVISCSQNASFDLFYGNLFSPQCTIEWRLAASCNQRSSKKMLFNVQKMHFI